MIDLSDIAWRLAAVATLVFLNGFFVAAEFALIAVRRTRIEQLVSEGSGSARVVKGAIDNLDRYIAGTQVGITIASIALGWVGEPALAELLTPFLSRFDTLISETAIHTISIAIAFTVITFLHVILGELVPKSLALQKPEATALILGRPMKFAVTVFQPVIWSLNGLGNRLLRLIGLSPAAGHESVHSAQELELLVRQSHEAGELDDLERRMLQRTFRFSETAVADIMVPRSEMTALDLLQPVSELLDEVADSHHSRFPVYEDTIDRIVGIIYVHDLFRLARSKEGIKDLRGIVRTPLFVPESLNLDVMIERFRAQKMQIAIVVDEYGGTSGLITLENIIEAVFGEFQDQNEEEPPQISKADDGTIILRGDARLVEVNEAMGWELEAEGVDTIAGYIMVQLGRVARVGDITTDEHGHQFRVAAMERHRIVKVIVTPAQRSRGDGSEQAAPSA